MAAEGLAILGIGVIIALIAIGALGSISHPSSTPYLNRTECQQIFGTGNWNATEISNDTLLHISVEYFNIDAELKAAYYVSCATSNGTAWFIMLNTSQPQDFFSLVAGGSVMDEGIVSYSVGTVFSDKNLTQFLRDAHAVGIGTGVSNGNVVLMQKGNLVVAGYIPSALAVSTNNAISAFASGNLTT